MLTVRSSASALRRHPSYSPMVLLCSSQWSLSVFITDGAAPIFIHDRFLRWSCVSSVDHQRLSVRMGQRHVRCVQLTQSSACAHWASPSPVLSHHPCSAGCSTCACSCSGPTTCSGPSVRDLSGTIYPSFSSHPIHEQCTVIVSFRPYVQV
jgi:hypothetical protein